MQMYKKVAYKCMTSHLRCTRNAVHFRSLYRFNVNCLHSALFICTALIFKRFKRVDNSKIYLHAVCTQLHSCLHHLHLFTLVCTIYFACTYQHRCKCTRVVPTTHCGIGGRVLPVAPTEKTSSLCRSERLARPLLRKHLAYRIRLLV